MDLDAIAAVDVALWDLKRKAWQAPVCEILGGPFRERLPAYISGLRKPTAAERIPLARECMQRGFRGVKMFFGAGVDNLGEELAAIREAIGPEGFLALDNINAHPLGEALRIGRDLDRVGGSWYEAPTLAEDIAGHRTLARRLSTPIAGGENLRSVAQFLPWVRTKKPGDRTLSPHDNRPPARGEPAFCQICSIGERLVKNETSMARGSDASCLNTWWPNATSPAIRKQVIATR